MVKIYEDYLDDECDKISVENFELKKALRSVMEVLAGTNITSDDFQSLFKRRILMKTFMKVEDVSK